MQLTRSEPGVARANTAVSLCTNHTSGALQRAPPTSALRRPRTSSRARLMIRHTASDRSPNARASAERHGTGQDWHLSWRDVVVPPEEVHAPHDPRFTITDTVAEMRRVEIPLLQPVIGRTTFVRALVDEVDRRRPEIVVSYRSRSSSATATWAGRAPDRGVREIYEPLDEAVERAHQVDDVDDTCSTSWQVLHSLGCSCRTARGGDTTAPTSTRRRRWSLGLVHADEQDELCITLKRASRAST